MHHANGRAWQDGYALDRLISCYYTG